MGFSLQAVDEHGCNREEYESLSYSNKAMRARIDVVANAPGPSIPEEAQVHPALNWNNGELVTAARSRWIAERLAGADRERIMVEEANPEELLGLIDAFKAFCERCADGGGFEVW